MTPLIFVAFPGLLWLDEGSAGPWASARLGYVFGLGFFAAGLYWIAAALFVDIARFWWAAAVRRIRRAGLHGAVLRRRAGPDRIRGAAACGWRRLARVCLFAVAWSAAEWLRGHVLTGFPWNLVGYVWAGGFPGALAMLQSTAWVGIYGLSFLTVLAASLPALLGGTSLLPMPRALRAAPAVAAALLILLPAACRRNPAEAAADPARATHGCASCSPRCRRSIRWDPAAAEANFRGLIELSGEPSTHKLAAVIWPEAAAPFLLERDPVHRAAVAAVAPNGGYVITGAVRANPPRRRAEPATQVWNSIEAIDGDGRDPRGLRQGASRAVRRVHAVSRAAADRRLYSGGDRHDARSGAAHPDAAGPAGVCRDGMLRGDLPGPRTPQRKPAARPAWMLNVTNDAWYGRSSGPYQHFAIARTRAVEEGMPLVRAANNGISGVVDPAGRVVARTRLDSVGYADIALPDWRSRPCTRRPAIGFFWRCCCSVSCRSRRGAAIRGRPVELRLARMALRSS